MQRKVNSLTLTYLSKVSFASLNGADKEVDNINPIKKITLPNGQEIPYVSSQAIRRALRNQLEELGHSISLVQAASESKGAPKTSMEPENYIDDDLFGYMDAKAGKDGGKGKATVRTSPIRVESLVALSDYKGDLDYATNFMGKEQGIDPNIFETEIHSGVYRGSILIELDRIGTGSGFEDGELPVEKRKERVLAFLEAFRNLWSSGRQTRFLADISPKFVAAACMKVKNPIFLEAVNMTQDGQVDTAILESVKNDYAEYIEDSVFAIQQAALQANAENVVSLQDGFEQIRTWIENYYKA